MPELIQFQVIQVPAMKVVGKEIRPTMNAPENPIPAFWSACFADGTFAALEALNQAALDGAYIGFMCDYSAGDGKFTYICGMFMKPGCPVPEGFAARDVKEGSVAVGWVRGPERENYPVAHELTCAAMKKAGHAPADAAGWCAEVYNCPRFTTPQENGDVILDYYIPCLQQSL